MVEENVIRRASPRDTVHCRFPDGRIFEAPIGTEVGPVVRAARAEERRTAPASQRAACDPAPDVAALVGGRLRELATPLVTDTEIRPVTAADTDGSRIYRRSLTFLLMTAAAEVFPEAAISIEHSATTVGRLLLRGAGPATVHAAGASADRGADARDRGSDARIDKAQVPLAEAMAIFHSSGEEDKVRLLAHREKPVLTLYRLRGRQDYFQGYMVPSAGCLRYFALHAFPPGFMLQFPHQSRPTEIAPITPYPKLFTVFEEAGHWLDRLGIRSAGALNDAIAAGRLPEVSLVAEALHEARIAQIAADITSHAQAGRPGVRGRTVVVRQDDVLEAPRGAAAGERTPAASRSGSTTTSWTGTGRRGTRAGSRTTSAWRPSTWRCSTSTCWR